MATEPPKLETTARTDAAVPFCRAIGIARRTRSRFMPSLQSVDQLSSDRPQASQGRSSTGQSSGDQTERIGAGKSSRSEEHTSELQSLMRISYAVFCLKKKKKQQQQENKADT